MKPLAALALASLAAPALAETLTVGPDAEHDYEMIQAAIDAAAPGDTVLVFGPHVYGEGIVIDKPLTLATGTELAPVVLPFLQPAPAIGGIAAGERVVISGLRFLTSGGVNVRDCEGLVVLHDVEITTSALTSHVHDASAVLLSRVAHRAGKLDSGRYLDVRGSELWAVDSLFLDLAPMTLLFGEPQVYVTHSLRDSVAHYAGSIVLGASWSETQAPPGGDAAWIRNSRVELKRSVFAGGRGGGDVGGSAARLAAASTLSASDNSLVVGGFDASGAVQAADVLVSADSQFLRSSGLAPTLSASPPRLASGDLLLAVFGQPGASGPVFASPELRAPWTLPGIEGEVFLDERSLVSLGTIELDAAGAGVLSVPVSAGPVFPGGVAVVQWIAAGPGATAISNPALVYRIPE